MLSDGLVQSIGEPAEALDVAHSGRGQLGAAAARTACLRFYDWLAQTFLNFVHLLPRDAVRDAHFLSAAGDGPGLGDSFEKRNTPGA